MSLGKIIDWIGKNLSRIKTIGMLVLVGFFVLSLVRNGCDRAEAEEMVERITGLNIRNDILMEDVKERDSLLIAKDESIDSLQSLLTLSQERGDSLQYNYTELEWELQSLSDSINELPVDTSYYFLVDEAYPYPGHLRFPFNELQVRSMHTTFLEKIKLDEMNLNLLSQIDEKDHQLEVQEAVVYEHEMSIQLMEESRVDLDSIILNQDEIIEIQGKQIETTKRRRTVLEIVGGVILVVITAFAAGGG